jgi:hypothetical protein
MKSKIAWLGGVLLLATAGAAWLRERSCAEQAVILPDRSQVARSQPVPGPAHSARRAPERELPGPPPPSPAESEPRRDSPDHALIEQLFTPPGPDATEAVRQAWERSAISAYIHAPGHPCEGLPTSAASVRVLVDAAVRDPLLDEMAEIDRPQILLEGRKQSYPLNNSCENLDREDPESVERFITCFENLPEDPRARPVAIWLPVDADRPGATTLREHYTRLIENRAAQLMAGPRCDR